jgi:hypothetical protein
MCPTSLPGPGARCRQAASAGGVPHLLSYRAAGTSRVNVAMKSRAQASKSCGSCQGSRSPANIEGHFDGLREHPPAELVHPCLRSLKGLDREVGFARKGRPRFSSTAGRRAKQRERGGRLPAVLRFVQRIRQLDDPGAVVVS